MVLGYLIINQTTYTTTIPSEHRATATRLNLSETKLIASASRLNKDESRLTEDYC